MHSGHRDRMKKKLLEGDINYFDEHEILEFLLYYSIPRKNTNPIAHDLIDKFGSLSNVLRASMKDLKTVKGIGESSAILIKIIEESTKFFVTEENNANKPDSKFNLKKLIIEKMSQIDSNIILLTLYGHNYRILYNGIVSYENIENYSKYKSDITRLSQFYRAHNAIISYRDSSRNDISPLSDKPIVLKLQSMFNSLNINLKDFIKFTSKYDYISIIDSAKRFKKLIKTRSDIFYGKD